MIELPNEIITRFVEETSDEHGAIRLVHLPEYGVLVDLETCCVAELLDAAVAKLAEQLADVQASIAVCNRRVAELERRAQS